MQIDVFAILQQSESLVLFVCIVLTIIGTYFRGPYWSWVWPWEETHAVHGVV